MAIYYLEWYNVQVEGEEVKGFTLLKYMDRAGVNQLYWGERADIYITRNKDILLKIIRPSHPCLFSVHGPAYEHHCQSLPLPECKVVFYF